MVEVLWGSMAGWTVILMLKVCFVVVMNLFPRRVLFADAMLIQARIMSNAVYGLPVPAMSVSQTSILPSTELGLPEPGAVMTYAVFMWGPPRVTANDGCEVLMVPVILPPSAKRWSCLPAGLAGK